MIYHGNNIEVLKSFADNSIDSIVTDPPYGLSFMNKHWDYDVPSIELWKECLRVLKPGGHLLSFAGTRTYHRMTVRIEDAGFEIRDMISWIYGSGFPKSLDISKAIDKIGSNNGIVIRNEIADLINKSGRGDKEIASICGVSPALVRFWRLRERSIQEVEAIKLRNILDNLIPNKAEREVIGKKENQMSSWNTDGSTKFIDRDITAPATPEAIQWNGWGTALKPACEPICVARKPFNSTVAENVLQYGTGGINIDGCRIEFIKHKDGDRSFSPFAGVSKTKTKGGEIYGVYQNQSQRETQETHLKTQTQGRFPANIIFDEIAGVMLDEMSGELKSGTNKKGSIVNANHKNTSMAGKLNPLILDREYEANSGGASRFFYCAKASKAERNGGLEGFEEKSIDIQQPHNSKVLTERYEMKSKNHHPTVKPLKLMQYLVRLVTPPNGVCLDPFCGSGTTLMACVKEGFNYIGIEREAEYVKIAEARVEWIKKQKKEIPEQTNLFKPAI